MHTLEELEAADFRYVSDGRPVRKKEVMPELSIDGRLGIVMGHGTEGIGAGNFILSSVIDFYDTLQEQKQDFFEYPDFYTFQATTDPADYRMFDIYPNNKNVVTEADPEAILRAVNDRAIAILLVPNRSPSSPQIEDITHRSAERCIESCYLYSRQSQLDNDSFQIEAPRQPIEHWFRTTAESTSIPSDNQTWRTGIADDQRISQHYRRISLDRALDYLPDDDYN
jgi:hypothetical protein